MLLFSTKGLCMKKLIILSYFTFIFMAISLSATPILKLEENTEVYTDFSVEYFEESSDHTPLSIDTVTKLDMNLTSSNAFRFGYKNNPIWLKFNIYNNTSEAKDMILELTEMFHKTVDLYIKSGDNIVYEKNGLSVPLNERNIKKMNPSFSLYLDQNEMKEIYIKVESTYGIFGSVQVKLPEQYKQDTLLKNNILIFYFGAVLIIALYNLFIYFSLREKIYLYYVGYVLTFSLWVSLYRGFIIHYVDMYTYDLIQISVPLFFIMLTLFSQSILDIKKYIPIMHKILNIFIFIILLSLLWMFISLHNGFHFMNIVITPLLPLLLFTGIFISRKGNKIAKIYLFILFIYFIGMGLVSMLSLGLIPYTILTSNAPIIGSFFEIILFSFLLAYRINLLREEKLETKEKLLKQKETESIRLSKMVQNKTSELNELNKRLSIELEEKKKLEKILLIKASTDSLTDILNRRAFFDECIKVVEISKRYQHDLSFIIIDIDYFKEINDTYGHLNGDIVLIDMVKVIQNTIRTTDVFGRIGGEEFSVLMPETNQEDAVNLAERIRKNIALNESILEENTINVTVSIGLSSLTEEDSIIQTVLRRADLALFKAKENGRNQTLSFDNL